MRRRRVQVLLLSIAVSGAVVATLSASHAPATSDPAPVGGFSQPFAEDPTFDARPPETLDEARRLPTAIHLAMLPDGRILYWGDWGGFEGRAVPLDGTTIMHSRSRILDLRSGTPQWSTPGNEEATVGESPEDLFCVDQRLLADGRLLAVGGAVYRNDPLDAGPLTGDSSGTFENYGSSATRWLDVRRPAPAWEGTDENRMHFRRWYPATITLRDGRVLVASGVERLLYNVPPLDEGSGTNVQRLETFDPGTNTWTVAPESAAVSLPLYPRLHVMHDGRVLYAGAGMVWNPRGDAPDGALWGLHKLYDPATQAWTVAGAGAFGAPRSDPLSVPLLLKPPYDRTQLLIAGGTLGPPPTAYLGTRLSEVVTYAGGRTDSEPTGDLNNRRWFSSGVLLPSGEVLALSGGDRNTNVVFGSETAVRQAELFDPAAGTWTPLASGHRDRTYHGSAILLPDGRVLVGGHAPQPDLSGRNNEDSATVESGLTANNLKDPSFEIFTPPYLDPSRGPRPRITHAPEAWSYGSQPQQMHVQGDVERVVLMHLPATTHVTDADQRGVELQVVQRRGSILDVTPPPDGGVAPPGYYYLFALSETGVPSKARIVQVGESLKLRGSAPAPFGI